MQGAEVARIRMIRPDDLDRVASLVHDLLPALGEQRVSDLLTSPGGPLRRSDIWRLMRSAECAHHAGQMDRSVFVILRHLCEELRDTPEDARFVSLDETEAWRSALAVADANGRWPFMEARDKDRRQVVGEACARLRKRGRKVQIKAHGPDWNGRSLRDACRSIDHLVAKLGGSGVLNQCGSLLAAMDRTFEDVWLLGDRNLGMGQAKEPAVPVGWLVGLAARHMHRPNTCRNPSVAWRSLLEQAWDVGASFDCQRYTYFENIGGISVGQFDETMSEMIGWRALFFTPQAPRLLLPCLQAAFARVLPKDRHRAVRALILGLFWEMGDLACHLSGTRCTVIRRADAHRAYPNLAARAHAPKGTVNVDYLLPLRGAARTDTGTVLFDGPRDDLVVRPVAMTIHAFCETVFGIVAERFGDAAGELRGNILEEAVEDACRGKADQVWRSLKYGSKRNRLEIDVAARTGTEVTLIETKAKSLTLQGQVGTSGQFHADYARSFVLMVEQLARHDRHLRAGATPIASAEEVGSMKVERIAVSPVSFGPIGDGPTTTALMSILPGIRLKPADDADETARHSTKAFNDAVSKMVAELALAIPKDEDGKQDLFDFFLFTHWVDLGQLLVALHHADRVDEALRPIRHLTTGSRDFWTEFAFARTMRQS